MTNLLNKSLKEQGIYKLELLVIKLLCIIRVKCTVYCGAETSHHYDDVTENNGDASSVHPSSWLWLTITDPIQSHISFTINPLKLKHDTPLQSFL